MKLSFTSQRGMTLVELLFSMGILGMVATGIYQLLLVHLNNYRFQQSLADRQQNGRIALSTLAREFRWVGYGLLTTHPADFGSAQSCHPLALSRSYELVNEQSIRFLSNLYGVQAELSREALPGDTELSIPDDLHTQGNGLTMSQGQEFDRNDTIYIYHLSSESEGAETPAVLYVECHKLASPGTSGRIRLALGDSIRRPFPVGSPIHVINELHYFLDPDKKRMMRRIDGGTDVLAEGVEAVTFRDLGHRISIQLTLKNNSQSWSKRMSALETSVMVRN
ncbi:MAG: prepilin-type N-terminal cleavage/methylation domain-containing protein [Nitrospira sp.]|nr:prepilin-type N-terminal cleavage/methylation domain-containing protein [Nitrospira sp.]